MTKHEKARKKIWEMMNDKRNIFSVRMDFFKIAPGEKAVWLQQLIDSNFQEEKDEHGYFDLLLIKKDWVFPGIKKELEAEHDKEMHRAIRFLCKNRLIKVKNGKVKVFPNRIENAIDKAIDLELNKRTARLKKKGSSK